MGLRTYTQPDADGISLGYLEMNYRTKKGSGSTPTTIGGNQGRCWVYRAAAGNMNDHLYLIDVVCTAMEYRAIHAGLTSGLEARFKFHDCGVGSHRTLEREPQYGYRSFTHRITVPGHKQNGRIHYIAVSQHPSFLPSVSERALAYKLGGMEFGVPILTPHLHGDGVPDWIPHLSERLVEENMLIYLESHNCVAGFLHPREEALKQAVTEGVKSGHLVWPKYDADEIRQAQADTATGLAREQVEADRLTTDQSNAKSLPTEVVDKPQEEEEI